jgi:excisionase family DNA binding protein
MTVYEQIIKANSLDKQMTIDETASYLNLSRDTVIKRIRHGKIKATSHGKQKRILKAQFHDS